MDVYFDGEKIGPFGTGLFRDLPAGPHTVELRGAGLYWKEAVELKAHETVQIQAEPEVAAGEVVGASTISINGVFEDAELTPGGDEDFYLVDGKKIIEHTTSMNIPVEKRFGVMVYGSQTKFDNFKVHTKDGKELYSNDFGEK